MQKVVIAVCSKRRPLMLQHCLASLLALRSPENTDVHICIVENDEEPQLESLVSDLSAGRNAKVHYVSEPKAGIPFARNKALDYAREINCDWLMFLDDDEYVSDTWLIDILSVAQAHEADVAVGPVIYRYPEDSTWGECLYEERNQRKKADGQVVRSAATNNVAISNHVFSSEGLSLRFDQTLRFTGGSDTDFFNRAKDLGAKLIWAQASPVFEDVPMERCTLKWAFSRSSRITSAAVYIDAKNTGKSSATVKHLRRSGQDLGKALGYLILTLLSLLCFSSWRGSFLKSWQSAARLWGRVWGIAGGSMQPYRDVDGH